MESAFFDHFASMSSIGKTFTFSDLWLGINLGSHSQNPPLEFRMKRDPDDTMNSGVPKLYFKDSPEDVLGTHSSSFKTGFKK